MSASTSSDLEQLQVAEQKLLGALQAATRVVELLGGAGAPRAELEALCSTFLADVQHSQVALLQLADRHQQPLPFQNSDCRQRLELAARRREVEAAEAQLAAAVAGGGAAGAAAAAGGGAAGAAAAAAAAGGAR